MAIVRPGIHLEDNKPTRSQFRVGRRSKPKPVIVAHTSESLPDHIGDDPTAEGVADRIVRRTDAGSYHLLGDRDSIVQPVRLSNEAFGDATGSNSWAFHVSLAMRANDWPKLSLQLRRQYAATFVQMAIIVARYCTSIDLGPPAAKLLTKAESDLPGASGFIAHGTRDPGRRYDPGPDFPWGDVLAEYSIQVEQLEPEVTKQDWKDLQAALVGVGASPGPVDGVPGKLTRAGLLEAFEIAGGQPVIVRSQYDAVAQELDDLKARLGGRSIEEIIKSHDDLGVLRAILQTG